MNWQLHADLKDYRSSPTPCRHNQLRARFDYIFCQRTGFVSLGMQRGIWMVEHGQQFGLVGIQPLQQAIGLRPWNACVKGLPIAAKPAVPPRGQMSRPESVRTPCTETAATSAAAAPRSA